MLSTCWAEVIHDRAKLERLAHEWDSLFTAAEAVEPVLSPAWLLSWWDVFGSHQKRELRVIAVREGAGNLVGLLPLLVRPVPPTLRNPIPLRRLELLGSGEDAADEICSEYIGAIVRSGWEAQVAEAAAKLLLTTAEVGRWDELVMPSMRGEDPFIPAFQHALGQLGANVAAGATGLSTYIPLPASWDQYVSSLSPSRRYFVRSSLRRFERWAGTWEVHRASSAPENLQALRMMRELHGERWGGGGAFRSDLFSAFHAKVCERLAGDSSGRAEISWLTVHGQPVAAQYDYRRGGRVRYYQAGRKLDVPPDVRVGIVLLLLSIRRAIEEGCVEFDFLATERQFKSQLATRRRLIVTLRAVPPTGLAPAIETARQRWEAVLHVARAARSLSTRDWRRDFFDQRGLLTNRERRSAQRTAAPPVPTTVVAGSPSSTTVAQEFSPLEANRGLPGASSTQHARERW